MHYNCPVRQTDSKQCPFLSENLKNLCRSFDKITSVQNKNTIEVRMQIYPSTMGVIGVVIKGNVRLITKTDETKFVAFTFLKSILQV